MYSHTYQSINSYGVIGDCHSVVLVSPDGSIDWGCLPDFDSPALFCRLLDAEQGGYFQVAPTDKAIPGSQRYLPRPPRGARGNAAVLSSGLRKCQQCPHPRREGARGNRRCENFGSASRRSTALQRALYLLGNRGGQHRDSFGNIVLQH